MTISRKSIFFLGIFIFLIPFFGFPTFWKTLFTIFSGILLIFLSVKISVPKKMVRGRAKKEKVNSVISEISFYPKDDTIESSQNRSSLKKSDQ